MSGRDRCICAELVPQFFDCLMVIIVDWEAVSRVGKVPCPAGKFFHDQGPGEDCVSDDGAEADAGSFAVCQVMSGIGRSSVLAV